MNRIFLLIVLLIMLTPATYSQSDDSQQNTRGSIPLGLGATFIDGETYYLVNLAPEVAFGNLGIGLDLNLRFSSKGKLRSEYNKFEDYLRIIRYVRWAQKGDPFYIRIGQLDYAQLGHGFILYNYRNTSSYDLRKVGLELDLNFDKFGFESVISEFANAGIVGLRGYVKPLKFTTLETVPVINNFEVGATFVSDFHENADIRVDRTTGAIRDEGAMSIVGFDVGLPLLSYRIIKSTLYFDYAKIIDFGSGSAIGLDLKFSGLGLIQLYGKYERRFSGDRFLPAYFNALYERDRFVRTSTGTIFSKADSLQNAKASQGNYGEVVISVLNTFNIVGAYQSPVGVKNAGVFHAEVNTGEVIPSILFAAGFDKKNVGKVFKLDDNAVMYAEVGYKPIPFMIISTVYHWTWTLDNQGHYKTQRRIEPKVSFVYNF